MSIPAPQSVLWALSAGPFYEERQTRGRQFPARQGEHLVARGTHGRESMPQEVLLLARRGDR